MYIFYWNNKRLAALAVGVLVVLVFGVGMYGLQNIPVTNVTANMEPIYRGNTDKQVVALAVNVDWGENIIPEMLDTLEDNEATATFFITGRFATKFPSVVKNISQQGHEIGNHGYSHPHVKNLSKAKNQEEITRTENIIEEITGQKTVLFAPPYGEKEKHVSDAAAEIGYRTVFWTVDTVDWQAGSSAQGIVNKVMGKVGNGAIILIHPKEITLEYLPLLLRQLKDKGYSTTTVSEIIKN